MGMTLNELKAQTTRPKPLPLKTIKGIAVVIGLIIFCILVASCWDTIVTLTIGFAILFGIAIVGLGPLGILALVVISMLSRQD